MAWVLHRTFDMLGEVWLFSRGDETCTVKEKYILYRKRLTPAVVALVQVLVLVLILFKKCIVILDI